MEQRYKERIDMLHSLSAKLQEHVELMEAKVREVKATLSGFEQGDPIMSSVDSCVSETDYCICGRPSFGTMIACDRPGCILEWFHIECVGLAGAPLGTWICPACKQEEVLAELVEEKHNIELSSL